MRSRVNGWARVQLGGPLLPQPGRSGDLVLLEVLVVLTFTLGPIFSLMSIQGRVIQITELMMAAVLVLSLHRLGVPAALSLLRRRLPLIALGVLVVAAVIGLARGLAEFEPSQVVYDVRLYEYAALLVIVVLAVDSRERFGMLVRTLAAGAMIGTFTFLLSATVARATNSPPILSDAEGEIGMAGLYATIAAVWVAARVASGARPRAFEIAVVVAALLLVGLTDKRAAWVAALAALMTVALLAVEGRRLWLTALSVLAVVSGVAGAAAIELVLGKSPPKVPGLERSDGDGSGDDGDGTQIGNELGGLVGDSPEAENIRWRIAYWGELLERSVKEPILGAGFGPARFNWEKQPYDYRQGNEAYANDVTGPHNAFVSVLYRTGVIGLAALLAAIAFPLPALWRDLRATQSRARRRELLTLAGVLVGALAFTLLAEGLRAQFLALFFWIPLGLLMVNRGLGDGARPDSALDRVAPARDLPIAVAREH